MHREIGIEGDIKWWSRGHWDKCTKKVEDQERLLMSSGSKFSQILQMEATKERIKAEQKRGVNGGNRW